MTTILVIGGAGYIGSHACKLFTKSKYNVIIFDNLSTGFKSLVKYGELFYGDLKNIEDIKKVFELYQIDVVVHFAASAYIGESVLNPQKYYTNNVVNTLNLLNIMVEYNIKNLIFSSTCAVFGNPKYLPIDEKHIKSPINPYGKTKLIIEQILEDYDTAYGIKSVVLRYFNAAGADRNSELGELHDPEPHIIPIILEVVDGIRDTLIINGNDYKTEDGTCVRDYIHVEDLADAHLKAIHYLEHNKMSNDFNLGTGVGVSIYDLIKQVEYLTNCKINYKISKRREGDPPILIADNKKSNDILGWKAKYSNIQNIIQSAIDFNSNKKVYSK